MQYINIPCGLHCEQQPSCPIVNEALLSTYLSCNTQQKRWTEDVVLHTGVRADGEERACCQAERQEGALLYSCGVGDNTGREGED
jgi:hypothetical protein